MLEISQVCWQECGVNRERIFEQKRPGGRIECYEHFLSLVAL
jgi:hypothetical protein